MTESLISYRSFDCSGITLRWTMLVTSRMAPLVVTHILYFPSYHSIRLRDLVILEVNAMASTISA